MFVIEIFLIITIRFEYGLIVKVGIACCFAVAVDDLRLRRMIYAFCALVCLIREVGAPSQSVYYLKVLFTGNLHTLIYRILYIFINHRQRIIVLGNAIRTEPSAIFILDRLEW